VVDYLLKPIPFPRFIKAFERALKARKAGTGQVQDYIFLKVDKSYVRVQVDDILYVESVKDYVSVTTKQSTLVSFQSLTAITESLPSERFLRIHRSFTIAMDKVSRIKGNNVEIEGNLIPISRDMKPLVIKKLVGQNRNLQ
jgi:DNA-binding LytR/AlgR family response regulator